jgi:hypothetical protein
VYDSHRGWTGKLRIPGEDQEAGLVDKRAIGDELFALGYRARIDLGSAQAIRVSEGKEELDGCRYSYLSIPDIISHELTHAFLLESSQLMI